MQLYSGTEWYIQQYNLTVVSLHIYEYPSTSGKHMTNCCFWFVRGTISIDIVCYNVPGTAYTLRLLIE